MKKLLSRLFGASKIETRPEPEYPGDKIVRRFFFEWAADTCLWSANDRSVELFGAGALGLNLFSLSDGLKQTLLDMGEEFQDALDWSEPQNPSPWSKEQKDCFLRRSREVYTQLCAELGDEYEVLFEVFLPE